ncbi:glycosyltransferase [Glycomyces luteolus]|uniref:Glycosyltransferase n=1 Tax=Glycomyces luteolus TaxID=2670330 RepID=A0A9X3PC77_9ACTN|nr:glycosyltransferase [Glycomyces luteolus]MDA1361037.1 glycosyltransferase [Glycomyces luteolus]
MTDSRPLRVLFVAFSRSSLGHVTRMRTAARRFADAGHTVAVAAHEEVRHLVEHAGLQWIGIDEIGPAPAWRGMNDVASLRAFARTRLASPEYVEASLRDELRAIDEFAPDAVVSDMRNTASVAASMRGLPSFTCHNLRLFKHPMHAVLPEILATLEAIGVAPEHRAPLGDAVLVPDLALLDPLADVPAETAGLMAGLTSEIRHIGPLAPRELLEQPVRSEREPVLNITLGGSGAGDKDLLRVVAAASGLGVRLAVTLGVDGPDSDAMAAQVRAAAGDAETEIAAFRHDAVDLMSRSAAAVVHGGHSSMIEGLLCATPLVFTPQSAEQRGNAARVAGLGLGTVVADDDPAEAVTEAIQRALAADRDRHAAFASVLRSSDGAGAMLDVVERAVALREATGSADA